jgi:hypothetical protein
MEALAPGASVCETKPCWKATSTVGYKYSDRDVLPDGIRTITLRAGVDDHARILAKLKGDPVPMPTLPLTPPVEVQLQATNGECWSAVYSTPIVNDAVQFKAKAD